jgi:hypothetical protein
MKCLIKKLWILIDTTIAFDRLDTSSNFFVSGKKKWKMVYRVYITGYTQNIDF